PFRSFESNVGSAARPLGTTTTAIVNIKANEMGLLQRVLICHTPLSFFDLETLKLESTGLNLKSGETNTMTGSDFQNPPLENPPVNEKRKAGWIPGFAFSLRRFELEVSSMGNQFLESSFNNCRARRVSVSPAGLARKVFSSAIAVSRSPFFAYSTPR